MDVTMLTSAILIFILSCLTIFYLYFSRNYGYWKKRGIPYEKPSVFVGNLGHIMRTSMHDYMINLSKKYKKNDYFGIYLGQQPALVINSKELAKKALVQNFDHFQNRYSYAGDTSDPLSALNLFSVKNPLWSAMKHELAPMFTTLRIKHVTELMNLNSAELVRRIQIDHIENKKPVDVKELFLMYTSDTIGYTVFGLKVSVLKDLTSPLWYITRHMVHWTFRRGLEFIVIFLAPAMAKLLRLQFFSAPATEYLRRLFSEVVEQRKKLIHPNDKDLLNHLMKLKENFKLPEKLPDGESIQADDLILAQAAIFIIGAIETSASTLTFFLHELAHNPDKQEMLYKEISRAVEEKGKSVLEYNDLLELIYLTACLKETLRKYPALSFLDRQCNKTFKLTEDCTVEKGTPVLVNIVGIHLNEEYYPDPEGWRPERFEGLSDNDNNNFSFLSFGEGPRGCIGKRYGCMQVRTAIAHLLMNFRLEPTAPYAITSDPYSIALTPLCGNLVKFVPR